MIGQLTGKVIERTSSQVLIDVGGIGYELDAPISTLFGLPEAPHEVTLYTHFVVREDAQLLFGFLRRSDRDMFRVLIKVNGVGPKLGIAILSGMDGAALVRCVEDNDVSTLVKLPGIGKKTAERLLIELRDKVKAFTSSDGENMRSTPLFDQVESSESEAESALIALGYKPQDAAKAVKRVAEPGSTVEVLVKSALKSML
jgi:holliday junction DNA helicase RuvA